MSLRQCPQQVVPGVRRPMVAAMHKLENSRKSIPYAKRQPVVAEAWLT